MLRSLFRSGLNRRPNSEKQRNPKRNGSIQEQLCAWVLPGTSLGTTRKWRFRAGLGSALAC